MARVNVESAAFADPRFALLSTLAGYSEHEAFGRMIRVWHACYEREAYVLPGPMLRALLAAEPEIAVKAGLARAVKAGFYICGTKGRIEWVKECRKSNRERQKRKREKDRESRVTNALYPGALTLTPALALTPAPDPPEKNPPTPRASRARKPIGEEARDLVALYVEVIGIRATDATYRSAQKLVEAGNGTVGRVRAAIEAYRQAQVDPEYRIHPHNWFGQAAKWKAWEGRGAKPRPVQAPDINRLLTEEEMQEDRRGHS